MAATQQDPVDILQSMLNEILVQTGKAVLASRRDVPVSMASSVAVNKKITDSLTTYHFALDDLESEIIKAKAVLLRDLEKLQEAKRPIPIPEPAPKVTPPKATPVVPPAPVRSEPRPPVAEMMADLPSIAAHTVSVKQDVESPRAAPFPDMGGGMPSSIINLDVDQKPQVDGPKKAPNAPVAGRPATPPIPTKSSQSPVAQAKVAPAAPFAPQSNVIDDLLSIPPATAVGDSAATADMTGGDLSFTNMEFSLAPPPELPQGAPQAPMQEFDLTSFTQDAAGNGLLPLDNFALQPNPLAAVPASGAPAAPMQPDGNTQTNATDSIFELGDGNDMNNMDLDLKLEDGAEGENTFDDLFFTNDNNDSMDQFNDAFFGLN